MTKLPEVPEDFLALVQKIVGSAADDEPVELKASWIRLLLALAGRAPQARGRPKRSLRDQRQEMRILITARARKAELMAQGMTAARALTQAATEALPMLRNLSVSTVKAMIKRR